MDLREGTWSSPGSGVKLYNSGDVSIRWYENSQTITVNGEDKVEVKAILKSIASIAKEISLNHVVNTKVSEVRSDQPEAMLASFKGNDPLMVFKECVNVTKEFNAKLTIINNTLLEHSIKLNNLIPQDSES